MMKRYLLVVAVAAVSLTAFPASAHVTVQPNETIAESFSAFVVRVPNERGNASTIKVQVKFPPLAFVSFQDVEGWRRHVSMRNLDEPLESFGQELSEVVGAVTWTGGEIEPGEFAEFPFSAAMPAGEEALKFPAIQTYSNDEIVRWTGPEDADEPAALVQTVDLGELAAGGAGQLEVLQEVVHEFEEVNGRLDELSSGANGAQAQESAAAAEAESSSDDSNTGVLLGWIGIGVGGVALVLALLRHRT
jgi:uncharacterized protein YcnI